MDQKRGTGGLGDGIRSGIGILNAFKEAIEETIQEAATRGDLNPDRAKQAMRDAARRVQEGLGDARERLDFVPRKEFDDLRTEVVELRRRLDDLESSARGPTSADENELDMFPIDTE